MKLRTKMGAALGGMLAAGVTTVGVGTLLWHRETAREVARLRARAAAPGAGATRFTSDLLAGLPTPVVRYFGFALTPDQALIRRARIEWRGEFFNRSWAPMTATQHYTVLPPGYVWDATIRFAPMVPVFVRDAYLAGEGIMRGRMGGLMDVVNQRGTPGLASGALARWLGEAVWFPTALLPREGLSWAPIDDSTARATLVDGRTTVSIDFHFGTRGEVVRVSLIRMRDVNGTSVPTPWEGIIHPAYLRVDGMMIPASAEAAWLLPEGRLPYWRGRVLAASYDYEP
jgi:hypothetical protein